MRYLLLIYGNEAGMQSASKADMEQMMAAYGAYTQAMKTAGVMVAADRLKPSTAASTVRIADGKTKVPYYIHLNDQDIFAFAGLWDSSRTDQGEVIESCVHITMPANRVVGEIHNTKHRMPAILAKKSTPTARTSGSANWSLISGFALRVATARAAATMVAVAPTLEARSQVSPSNRALLICAHTCHPKPLKRNCR